MRILLVQRPIGNATIDEIRANPLKFVEPVAVICVGAQVTEAELNEMGLAILAAIGDKPVNTEQVMALYMALSAQ